MESLTNEERERYHRQIIFSGWGEEGQKKIKQATVFIAGAGGLGSPVAIYLAAAGVGRLRICDFGKPELSNLNRQILHTEEDIDKNKALSARETLNKINPHVKIENFSDKIERENVSRLVGDAQIIVDCMDNFPTRHILNEYALKAGLPFVHAGVSGMSGQITFIHTPETPCLYCIFPGSPPSELFPIVGATAGVIGTLEALEVLKHLTGKGRPLKNRMLFWDGELMNFHEIPLQKDPNCPICGKKG
jgi:adenylyltransferase/sulfurtransferase